MDISTQDEVPVIRDPKDFDASSGSRLERLIFNHRLTMIFISLVMSAFLGWHASKLEVNASFEKMIPQSHPYIKNFFDNKQALPSAGNAIRVAVESVDGDIFDKDYLLQLQKINDVLYLLPGVDRNWMRGLWTSSLRWTEVTEEGYRGGPVMPDGWDGSTEAMDQLRGNIGRANIIGSYISTDQKSSLIVVPLLDRDPATQKPLNYREFSESLEAQVRSLETDKVKIHIVGFAKVVGDLIDGLTQVGCDSLEFDRGVAHAGCAVARHLGSVRDGADAAIDLLGSRRRFLGVARHVAGGRALLGNRRGNG